MEWIACGRIDEIAGEHKDYDNEWVDPSVTKGEILPTTEETTRFSAFRMRAEYLGLGVALKRGQHVASG